MGWPKKVDVLTAEDVCKGTWTKGNQHCLSRYVNINFKDENVEPIVRQHLLDEIKKINPNLGIIGFNDDPKTTPSMIAKLWNKVMRKLGYKHILKG